MRAATALLLSIIVCLHVRAQRHPAAEDYFSRLTDCASSFGGWKCLNLDLTSELAGESDSTKTYGYSWNFGDGTRIQGDKIEHCYEQFGSYQLTMDLIDTETNTVIRNELSSTVHLYPETYPVVTHRSDGLPPTFREFSVQFGGLQGFDPDHVYWRIGTSTYEGPTIRHSFPVAGVYTVEMVMEKQMDFIGMVTACATQSVTIAASDIWTTDVVKYFGTMSAKLQSGPFTTGDVACFIKSKNPGDSTAAVVPLTTLLSSVSLREGQRYEIMLFAGNFFSARKQVDLYGLHGNELYRALMDTVRSFVDQPLRFFRPMTLTKDVAKEAGHLPELQETAALLKQFPELSIEIGAYLHTGSRITKGIETSLQRAAAVKDALAGYGIAPDRIRVASPEFNRALINTCSALADCPWENEALNGRIEIKITGATL